MVDRSPYISYLSFSDVSVKYISVKYEITTTCCSNIIFSKQKIRIINITPRYFQYIFNSHQIQVLNDLVKLLSYALQ